MPLSHNIRLLPTSAILISACFVAASLSSCGVNRKPHYPNKNYGQSADDQATEAQDPNEPREPSEPSKPNEPNEPSEPSEPSEPETPTDQVLSHYGFAGYFNLETTRQILRGPDSDRSGSVSPGGWKDAAAAFILKKIIGENTIESLAMLVRQNGVGHDTVKQDAVTGGGDNIAKLKQDDTQSGTQTIDWALSGSALSASCPSQFVCIERLVWVPTVGSTMTYCYFDYETKAPISIPYSPNSNYSAEAFAAALGSGITSRPIEVVTHPGNVACDAPVEIRDPRPVQYKLTMGTRSLPVLKRANHKPLTADAEIVIEYSLLGGEPLQPYLPKVGPFIDQLTRLNSKVSYFINSEKHVLVKIDRTIQSVLKIEISAITRYLRETYGETVASLFNADPSEDIEGLQLVYSFEFCTHLSVIPNDYNHCTGYITP